MRLQGFLILILSHFAFSFEGTSDELEDDADLIQSLEEKSADAINIFLGGKHKELDESDPGSVLKGTETLHDLRQVGNFGIVEPFPKNIYPIEFTPAKVTCVAYDTAGIEIPEKILFVRRNDFGEYRVLTANDNMYFTKRTEENGRKLFVTLHFRRITMQDDSLYGSYGRYECHAFAVGDVVARARHGFSVKVLRPQR